MGELCNETNRELGQGIALPYLWMLVGSVCFAMMAVLTESLRDHFTFPWITMIRSGVATLLAMSFAFAGGVRLVFLRPATLWVRSLSGWASMICGFYAMTHYHVEIVLALTNMYPLWVAILSWPLLRKPPTTRTWIALLISFIGMWLVYWSGLDSNTESQGATHQPWLAIPMAIAAGMLSGVALINLHRVKHIDTQAVVTHFSGVATALSFFVWTLLPVPLPSQPIDTPSIVRILGVGVAATFGQICLTKAFSSGTPSRVSVVGLSQVVVAAIVKWVTEGRTPTIGSLLGMTLVLTTTVWVILSRTDNPSPKVS